MMKEYFAFQWHITDECDQRCKHCYIFSEDNCKKLDAMTWEHIQDTFYNCLDFCEVYNRLPYFYITGGDPILHPDFWRLLELMKEHNIPFTIASASIKENIDFFVESFNLDKWIDPEMIIYDDGSYSNKVNMFKDAAQKLKHNVKDILVFEDSFSGIANAYKAGIEKIVVICPQEKESEYRDLPGVIMTIQDFSDFNKLI